MIQKLTISLILILIFYISSFYYDWFDFIWWLDTPMHLIGGAWTALFAIYIYNKYFDFQKNKLIFKLIIILSSVALVGIFWEFYEFIMDVIILKKYLFYNEPGYILFDTLKDLFNDLVGALIAFIFYFKRSQNQN
jgi:hypothetical protein